MDGALWDCDDMEWRREREKIQKVTGECASVRSFSEEQRGFVCGWRGEWDHVGLDQRGNSKYMGAT